MSIILRTFAPTALLGPGKSGLHWKKGATSSASLTGSGLVDGLYVTVLFPRHSPETVIKWTGTTFNSNPANNACDVILTETLENNGPHSHPVEDDTVTVSVMASDATGSSNTLEPAISTAP